MQPGRPRSAEHHARVRAIFDAALAMPAEQRPSFVRQQANDDPALETEVLRLLGAVRSAQQVGFLEKPAWKGPRGVEPVQDGMAFGAYRVIRQLGGGGMGSVYLVERADEVFHKVAALKVIRPECMTGDLLRRFQQERRILAELDHPNIARIIDGGTTHDGLPYFVMDYVEGEHIDRYCASRRFSVDQKLRLFIQICSAVQYLHAHRIIHRDLKPSNIVVTANGNVKLLDFGIAKALAESSTGRTKTTRVMTPGYASPEQMAGRGVTPASDSYSLAILLCELLTGSRPFPQEQEYAFGLVPGTPARQAVPPSALIGRNPTHVSAEAPVQLRQRLQGDLDTIVLMALRNEPDRRYPSAGALAADIELHLVGRPVSAHSESMSYRVSKFISRNRARIITAAVIFVLAAWALAASWIAMHPNEADVGRRVQEASEHLAQILKKIGLPGTGSFALPQELERQELADLQSVNKEYATTLARAIELHPGSTPERSNLIAEDEQYLDILTHAFAGDDAILTEAARGYLTLADLKGYPKHASLSDRAGALSLYEKAQSVLVSLPQSANTRQLLQTVNDHAAVTRGAG